MYLHYSYVAIAIFEVLDKKCSFFEVFGLFLGNHECLLQLVNAQELIGNQLFHAKQKIINCNLPLSIKLKD